MTWLIDCAHLWHISENSVDISNLFLFNVSDNIFLVVSHVISGFISASQHFLVLVLLVFGNYGKYYVYMVCDEPFLDRSGPFHANLHKWGFASHVPINKI